MDTKNLISRQVQWAQNLSKYQFWIDYQEGKVNRSADALFCFPQKSINEEEKLQAENTQILHCLQSSLINASFSGLSTLAKLLPLHQVIICGTYILSQLRQFWSNFRTRLADEGPYKASIREISLRLAELQELDEEARKIRTEGINGYEDIDGILHHQRLALIPEVI